MLVAGVEDVLVVCVVAAGLVAEFRGKETDVIFFELRLAAAAATAAAADEADEPT